MTDSAELFTLTLIMTGVLYACMLAYFNGWLGSRRANTVIQWNSEVILWIVLALLIATVMFRLIGPNMLNIGAGTWFLIGAGNLMVVFIYLVVKLARHTLPANGFWAAVALTIAANVYALVQVFLSIIAGEFTPTEYGLVLETLLLFMTEIVFLIVAFNLIYSLWTSFLQGRYRDPQSEGRHSAAGISGSQPTSLEPGTSLVVDFGIRRIEDHGYKADVRILQSGGDNPLNVEVSNDNQTWEACFLDENIKSDWDVPYLNSPWRYVRISNSGGETTSISQVYDLD